MTAAWFALHIFYGGDENSLLLEAVRPTLQRLRSDGAIDLYFFVRYWNGGPHVRVRVQCRWSARDVERELECGIAPFLRQTPGAMLEIAEYEASVARIREIEERLAAAAVDITEPFEQLQPPNSIQPRPYNFDARRYGAKTMDDTHDHAWVSSELAFAALEISRGNAGLIRMFALQAAAVVATLLNADVEDAATYFDQASHWGRAGGNAGGKEYWVQNGYVDYHNQRSALDTVKRLLDGQAISQSDPWAVLLLAWQSEARRRHAYLHGVWRAEEIRAEPDHLLLDALHLLCNRLGLTLLVECYSYYLLAALIRERAV
jgi:hypothetical protein